jgi:hypothetical protein
MAQDSAQFSVSEKGNDPNLLKTSAEPGRTRTCNPLIEFFLPPLRALNWLVSSAFSAHLAHVYSHIQAGTRYKIRYR